MQNTLKSNIKNQGFTIVELLVVIVVIGILAAITLVSYTGVTARAKTAQAASNASAAQSVAVAMNADNSSYPTTAASFSTESQSAKLPTGVTVVPGSTGTAGAFTTPAINTLWGTNILTANFATTVTWACLNSCTSPVAGGRITYYDFGTQAQSNTVVYVGAATANSNYVAPSS